MAGRLETDSSSLKLNFGTAIIYGKIMAIIHWDLITKLLEEFLLLLFPQLPFHILYRIVYLQIGTLRGHINITRPRVCKLGRYVVIPLFLLLL